MLRQSSPPYTPICMLTSAVKPIEYLGSHFVYSKIQLYGNQDSSENLWSAFWIRKSSHIHNRTTGLDSSIFKFHYVSFGFVCCIMVNATSVTYPFIVQ